MAKSIYNSLNGGQQNAFGSFGNAQNFMQKLNELKQTGVDPNQMIQQMLNSGKITQQQYDNARMQAQQIQQLIGHQNGSN